MSEDRAPSSARIAPRIEAEAEEVPRLTFARPLAVPEREEPGAGSAALITAGMAVLVLGFAALQTGLFAERAFREAPWLGWIVAVIGSVGFGLVLWGIGRELRALMALRAVDRLRRDLVSGTPEARVRAARHFLARVEGGDAVLPTLAALNDPDAITELLRAGVEAKLRRRCEALSRRAAAQVVAGMAATPAPSLVVLLVSWRAVRLIRQIALVYGLRPGWLATLRLLRRVIYAATSTAVTEAAVNTAAHAVLSTPLLTHLAGEMAGGAVAARRMIVLGRAAVVACSPLSVERE